MRVNDIFQRLGNDINVARVFGQPVERDGVTIVPVAFIAGGGGGGGGSNNGGESGEGGGFGGVVRPLGVFEIKDGTSRFIPAINVTAIVITIILSITLVQLRTLRKVRA